MENFKKELFDEGRVWFLKSSLKELKAATAEELEELLTLITTEIDYSDLNTVRKVARLIADSYLPIDFVDEFRKIHNQNLESYAFLSATSKDEETFEGSSLKIFAPLFRDEVFESKDRYTNPILAFDKFYQKELGVPAAMINWLDELEYGSGALTGLSIQYANPTEEDLEDWNLVYNVGERVGELTANIRKSIYSKQKNKKGWVFKLSLLLFQREDFIQIRYLKIDITGISEQF